MQHLTISALPLNGCGILVEDDISDQVALNNIALKNCRFVRLGLRDAKFKQSVIAQSRFEDCYLRKAEFIDVDLTGCVFRNCNLEKATFQGCNLKYCRFENTLVDFDEIATNLPTEPNLRLLLVRNLRMNCTALGDADTANKFLDLEIDAQTEDLWGIALRKSRYYKDHYDLGQQIAGWFRLVAWRLEGLVWGYGRQLSRLAISYALLILLFAAITCIFDISLLSAGSSKPMALPFMDCVLHAFGKTLGGVVSYGEPVSTTGRVLQICEALTGACFLALFASALYRRISR